MGEIPYASAYGAGGGLSTLRSFLAGAHMSGSAGDDAGRGRRGHEHVSRAAQEPPQYMFSNLKTRTGRPLGGGTADWLRHLVPLVRRWPVRARCLCSSRGGDCGVALVGTVPPSLPPHACAPGAAIPEHFVAPYRVGKSKWRKRASQAQRRQRRQQQQQRWQQRWQQQQHRWRSSSVAEQPQRAAVRGRPWVWRATPRPQVCVERTGLGCQALAHAATGRSVSVADASCAVVPRAPALRVPGAQW